MCGTENTETGARYLSLTQETLPEFPELNNDVYEIIADANYTRREMQEGCNIFAVDATLWESYRDIILRVVERLLMIGTAMDLTYRAP